ncbi:MAG: DUF58 domain-containing protein [Candidatus Omnitrophica bacterium]|nr:DUF58 domain-containing protein [Candidatus Omnitrophota bacterium]
MIPKEILKQVRNIEIRTTKLVNEFFGGEYQSVFKGQGIEFADVRSYTYGDDIRTIDWNVTARTGSPHVKQFMEERELAVVFLVDISSSHFFGSQDKLKSEVAAEISALLAFSAVKNNDKVGLLTFTDKVEKYIPMQKGTQHVLRVVREILYNKPEGVRTNLGQALEYINKVLTRRAVIFIISDFMDAGYDKPLKILARYHDAIGMIINDPRERALPNVGLIELEDPETGEVRCVNTSNKKLREQFEKQRTEDMKQLIKKLTSYGVDTINIDVTLPYVDPIMKFFMKREQRKHA